MYAYLKGILIEAHPTQVILECASIGYQIAIPAHTFSGLPQMGQELKLFTSFIIRENSQALYGFLSTSERDLFEALITVSGIGPKIGLSICGHLPPEELLGAISRNDLVLLTKVPGIGKKTAERMVIELRDKLKTLSISSPQAYQMSAFSNEDQQLRDALSALVNLGYHQNMAQKAIQKTLKETSGSLSLGELITNSLKHI